MEQYLIRTFGEYEVVSLDELMDYYGEASFEHDELCTKTVKLIGPTVNLQDVKP